jgi:hypothetical protein
LAVAAWPVKEHTTSLGDPALGARPSDRGV